MRFPSLIWRQGSASHCAGGNSRRASSITRTQNVAAPWIGFLSSADIRTDRADLETARQCEDHSARPDSLLGAFHLGDSTVLIPDLHRVLLA